VVECPRPRVLVGRTLAPGQIDRPCLAISIIKHFRPKAVGGWRQATCIDVSDCPSLRIERGGGPGQPVV
jgi:hypothetical protein